MCIFFKLSIKADVKLLCLWNTYHEASAEILKNVYVLFFTSGDKLTVWRRRKSKKEKRTWVKHL